MTATSIRVILATGLLCLFIGHCQARNQTADNGTDSDSSESNETLVYRARIQRRFRRQNQDSMSNSDTAATVLSILPLDRLGNIFGQIMSTGLKDMLDPNVGKKIVNVLENQAPMLLTSLFTNLYTNMRAPPPGRAFSTVKAATPASTINSSSKFTVKQLSNSSSLLNSLRNLATK